MEIENNKRLLLWLCFSGFTNGNANCDHIKWSTSKSHEIKVIAIKIYYSLLSYKHICKKMSLVFIKVFSKIIKILIFSCT